MSLAILVIIVLLLYLRLRPRRAVFLRDGEKGKIERDDMVVDVEFTEISSKITEGGRNVAEEKCRMDARSGSMRLFPNDSRYHDYAYVLTGEVSRKRDRVGVYLDKRV
ncbi:MAG: hypothetical protein Q8R30_01695 [bacterium]|nr:hypothetical protein [bacterium]